MSKNHRSRNKLIEIIRQDVPYFNDSQLAELSMLIHEEYRRRHKPNPVYQAGLYNSPIANTSIIPGDGSYMTTDQKIELAEQSFMDGKRENSLYIDVLMLVNSIKWFALSHELFSESEYKTLREEKRQQRIEMWSTLAAEFAKACRAYHAYLIRESRPVHGVFYKPDPSYIQDFLTAQATIQNALSYVIQNPDNVGELSKVLRQNPLDEQFVTTIQGQARRHRAKQVIDKAKQNDIGNEVIDLRNRRASLSVRGAADEVRIRLEDEERIYLSTETVIKYFYAVQNK